MPALQGRGSLLYLQIATQPGNHAEAIEIIFDPAKIEGKNIRTLRPCDKI
jgi:peptide methionine sulfoxide reductase MsrA